MDHARTVRNKFEHKGSNLVQVAAMQTYSVNETAQLADLEPSWNRLAAGNPFRSWQWLSTWWEHYSDKRQLWIAVVAENNGTVIGIAPWFRQRCRRHGRTIRFLGGGEICSDYLGILAQRGRENDVTAALAGWLSAPAPDAFDPHRDGTGWDRIALFGVDRQDPVMQQFSQRMLELGNTVNRRAGPSCWRIRLPETWEDYLALLSKSHRKQVRRLDRRLLESGRAQLHTIGDLRKLGSGLQTLVTLHQRRRQSLGQPGCFSSDAFAAFIDESSRRLLETNQLRLHRLDLDGRPLAAELHLVGGGVNYAYQAGVDPERLDEQPGHLITIATIKQAISAGNSDFDFLRGDEPYKAHFRAEARDSIELRFVPRRAWAQVRHRTSVAGATMKDWIRQGLQKTVQARRASE